LVANDPRVVAAIQDGFVPVAANDVDYANHADQSNFEVRWLREALSKAKHGLFQGLYVVTPAGELLCQADGGWPVYDANVTVRALALAKQQYAALSRERRLLGRSPDPVADRAWPVPSDEPAPGFARLAATKRTRPYAGMAPEDVRHPQHLHIDAVDVRAEWLAALVPQSPKRGEEASADPRLLFAFAEESVMQPECSVWREEEFVRRELVSTVKSVANGKVTLELEGVLELVAANEWNRGAAYDGRIAGRAVWNAREESFESFELVLFGAHSLRESERPNRKGSPTVDVAAHLVLER
jgi:hypothetical protein